MALIINVKKFLFLIFLFHSGFSGLIAQSIEKEEPISDLVAFCSEQKGFNLLGKFDVSWSNNGFTQKEFSMINELGFNFVRLPLDYRTYTQTGNWDVFIESKVAEIDRAIEWGLQYNVHVCVNLHRAPGYCVNSGTTLPANQQLDLWTDTIPQNAFLNHWEFFTNRYKNVSPQRLSFNLVNEPNSSVDSINYVKIMKRAIDVIHEISPNRLIFVDGLGYGSDIILSLKDEPNVAQAIHSYQPFNLTHYKASWVEGSSDWPVPEWPILSISTYLYGSWKNEFKSPLVLQGNFEKGTEITVNVRQVSIESTLRIKADNKIIYTKKFVCGPELGTDFTKIIESQWGYQNISNKDFSIVLGETSTILTIENSEGDWMTINSISIKQGDVINKYNLSDNSWGKKQATYVIDANGDLKTQDGNDLLPFQNYKKAFDLAIENNIPFMVQEFGVHNQTPHKVAVDFLTDLSAFFFDNNVGWALWNLTGSFGILNSSRSDCDYELFQGNQLDRAMLDALTKSGNTLSIPLNEQNPMKIYPSPAQNIIYLSGLDFRFPKTIEIRDIMGRVIKSFRTEPVGKETISLDISGLKSNVYLLSVAGNGKVLTKKFLVK